jgi:Protein of unknown function (DUF992)
MKKLRDLKRLLGGVAIVAAMAPVAAFAGNRVGVLECNTSGSSAGILVENQLLDCVYEDDDEGAGPVHYVGRLTKVGANISVNGPGEFVWVVGAATNHLGPGALTGIYAGPEASVKVGVGGGGAILVGGSNNTISLQPFSFEGGPGLGVTAGVERLVLDFVADVAPRRVKHKQLPVYK